jgi:hypothetical protein
MTKKETIRETVYYEKNWLHDVGLYEWSRTPTPAYECVTDMKWFWTHERSTAFESLGTRKNA